MVGWIKGLAEWWDPRSQLQEKDISPYFWPNGTMPHSAEFDALAADGFKQSRLRVGGLVENPRDFSLADLGAGEGGYNGDHEFDGCRMPI